jgi:hypothetical protein
VHTHQVVLYPILNQFKTSKSINEALLLNHSSKIKATSYDNIPEEGNQPIRISDLYLILQNHQAVYNIIFDAQRQFTRANPYIIREKSNPINLLCSILWETHSKNTNRKNSYLRTKQGDTLRNRLHTRWFNPVCYKQKDRQPKPGTVKFKIDTQNGLIRRAERTLLKGKGPKV